MSPFGGGPFASGLRGWLGYIGLVILFLVLINLLVRRLGGWRKLYRRTKNELTRTVRAFSEPVRAWVRYRRRLRFLIGVLRDERAWNDAERAIGFAAAIDAGSAPYAVLLAKERIGVLVAGAVPDALPAAWRRDSSDPRLWWIARADLDEYSGAPGHTPAQAPLLVCLGTDDTGRAAVLLDLLAGPPALSVYGVPRTARAVVQALAAQLDVRLPVGAVEVADGVHKGYAGMSLAEAVNRRGAWFVVGAEALQTALPAGLRLLSLGVARGSSRLVEALADGSLRLYGAADWLQVDPLPLARAVTRSVRSMPPHDFDSRPLQGPIAGHDDLDLQLGATGVSALTAADAGTDRKAPSWT